jgi:type VII secretion-associated serine protease mycosin
MAFTRTVRALGVTTLTGALMLAVAPAASADQTRDAQWALETLQAKSAWDVSRGAGVTVAVIDTGVNAGHVDLEGNVLRGKDFIDGDDDASPVSSEEQATHGTEIASIIAGHGHGEGAADGVMGLAPEAKILPIRVNIEGQSGFSDEIRYAVDSGASIINISMTLQDSQYANSASPEDLKAISYALDKDVLIVAGAGNDGTQGDLPFPANSAGVVAVGGIDRSGSAWGDSNSGPGIMLTAPAERIVSAGWPGNKLRITDGTSNSTAFVSGAAALLRSKYPDLTAGQIANRLVKTAVLPDASKGTSLPDERYGYGIIRPLAALTEDIPAGGKLGPLKAPGAQSASAIPGAGKSESDYASENKKADQKRMVVFGVLGLIGLVVVGLIVWLIVRSARRNRNGPGGPASPGGYPQYGEQSAPPQYNPYQQPAQPQQNPYQQQPPSPPQG